MNMGGRSLTISCSRGRPPCGVPYGHGSRGALAVAFCAQRLSSGKPCRFPLCYRHQKTGADGFVICPIHLAKAEEKKGAEKDTSV